MYQITNLVNGKIYIGVHRTNDLNDGYMGSGIEIKEAIKEFGGNSFKKEILEMFDSEDEMFTREACRVDMDFIQRNDTYNRALGGRRSALHTEEVKNRIRQARSTQVITEETKLKIRSRLKEIGYNHATFAGRTHTTETKQKMSMAQKGKHSGNRNSQFGTMWITDGKENKKIRKNDQIPEGWNKGRSVK